MKIYLDNNLGVEKVEHEELTQDTYGYNILKVYIPNAVLAPYDTFTCYYGALLQNGRKVGWFAMEARTNSDADYEANYTLYKATLEQSVVSVEGKVYIGCQVILGNSGNATLIKKNTAVVQFNVRKSVAINNDILILDPEQTTTDVLESYKQLLENALTTYATKAEVNSNLDLKADKSDTYTKAQTDNLLNSKADKSDTYTKQEVNQLTDGLSGEIDTVRKSVNSLNTRTSYLENTVDDLRASQQLADVVPTYVDLQEYYARPLDSEDKVQVLSDDTHDGASTVYKWDGSNWIYLGSYSSNTYNKTEVDGKFDGVGKEFETLSNDILSLQTSVSDLKSVQNVVDVVSTYADLQSYDTTKLETNDKIQVIADETHDGSSTIYKWDGSAWIYIGAFGGNSYTKPEVDTKLSTKSDKDDTYTKQEVNDKLNGYIKDNDTTYSATVRGKEVIVSAGAGYGSTTYKHNSIQTSNPRKPTCDYSFPDEKSGTLALTSDIPTVNNPTITFTQGGETKGSITLNQASDQTIDLDAGGISAVKLADIVDSQGNNRFINGYGIWSAVPGMQGIKATWSLNGYNLMFEALGSFSTDISGYNNFTIVSFNLPTWILNKISVPVGDIVDMITFKIVGTSGDYTDIPLFVKKPTTDKISFMVVGSITPTEPKLFRIRYNIIIDDL